MSSRLLRKLPLPTFRRAAMKNRGGGGGGSFFDAGKHEPGGLLFGEAPAKDGARKWESWEGPWYFTFGAATAILTIGLSARPDSSLTHWADRKAEEKLGSA